MRPSRGKTTLAEALQIADLAACVAGTESLFRHHFRPEPPANDRAWYMDGAARTVLETSIGRKSANGIMIANTGGGIFSTATETPAIERLAGTVPQDLRAARETR